jgi:hypothetical protein
VLLKSAFQPTAVLSAPSVLLKGERSIGGVALAVLLLKRPRRGSCILVPGVEKKRPGTSGRVEVASALLLSENQ